MNPYVLELLDQLEDPVILECGCHYGEDTAELVRGGFSRFYSFEADPRNIAVLEQRGLPEGVQLVKKAIGAQVGKTLLHQSTNIIKGHGVWTGSSSIRKPTAVLHEISPQLQFGAQVEVDVTTLDAFCEEEKIDFIDFIWVDIQGAERDLIEGGRRMIPRTHFLFMEQESFRFYEGQWLIDELLAELPDWRVIEKFPHDVFLENTKWTRAT